MAAACPGTTNGNRPLRIADTTGRQISAPKYPLSQHSIPTYCQKSRRLCFHFSNDRKHEAQRPEKTSLSLFRELKIVLPLKTESNWYCVHTKPRKERPVASYLRETLQLETYFPQLRQYRTIRRVRRLVTAPLFPRYLFCRFDLAASYRAVRYSPDTIEVVQFGESPAVVENSLIDELKVWAGEAFDIIDVRSPLQSGDQVEVIDGPMRGLSGKILRSNDDRDRVAILLSILECGVQISISRSQIKRTG